MNRPCPVPHRRGLRIAAAGLHAACSQDDGLADAVNMSAGKVTNRAVAETFGMPFEPFQP